MAAQTTGLLFGEPAVMCQDTRDGSVNRSFVFYFISFVLLSTGDLSRMDLGFALWQPGSKMDEWVDGCFIHPCHCNYIKKGPSTQKLRALTASDAVGVATETVFGRCRGGDFLQRLGL